MSISKLKRWMLGRSPEVRSDNRRDKLQHDLQQIAIIAQVTSATEVDLIRQYILKRSSEGMILSCLLYSRDKRLTDELLLDSKSVKWSGAPACDKTKGFLSQSYDLLYVPCKEYGLTLEYLIRQCDARLKVGVYNKEQAHYFDLLADTKNKEIIEIIKEMDVILRKIKKNG